MEGRWAGAERRKDPVKAGQQWRRFKQRRERTYTDLKEDCADATPRVPGVDLGKKIAFGLGPNLTYVLP